MNNSFLVQMIDSSDSDYRSFCMVRFGGDRQVAVDLFTKNYNNDRDAVIAADPEEWTTTQVFERLRARGWVIEYIDDVVDVAY